MAIFFTNKCHFQGCGLTYETLKDLILHIEQTHLDNPSSLIDRTTGFLPLSCIIRFYSEEEASRLPVPIPINQHHKASHVLTSTSGHHGGPHHRGHRATPASGGRRAQQAAAAAATAALQMDDSTAGNNSNTAEDTLDAQCRSVAAGVLAGLGVLGPQNGSGSTPTPTGQSLIGSPSNSVASRSSNSQNNQSHGVQCQHEGCNKRYKNINGLRYHMRHVHNRGGGVTGSSTTAPPPTVGGKHGFNSTSGTPQPPPAPAIQTSGDVQFAPRGRGGVIMRGGSIGPLGVHPATLQQQHRCRFCNYACRTLSELHNHQTTQHAGQLVHSTGQPVSGTSTPTGLAVSSDLRLALTSAPPGLVRTTSSVAATRMATAELLLGGEPPAKPLPAFVALVSAPQSQVQQASQHQIQQVQAQQTESSFQPQPQQSSLMQH